MPNPRYATAVIGALALTMSADVHATTFAEEDFVCPIGGEEFEANVVLSNTTWGQRPDGKPYSALPVYPVTECPQNGFLLFDENFTEEELQILEKATGTAEFQAMRETDTQHYRVWWLKNKVQRDEASQLSSLLRAGWETDHDYDRKVKYQSQFANLALNMVRTDENAAVWFYYNLRAVNILRELGYFDEGLKRLDFLMKPEYLPQDDQEKEGALFFADALRALLEQKNPFFEPANLVPERVAIFRCVAPKSPLTDAENTACASEEVTKAIADFRHKPKGGKKLRGAAAVQAADLDWRSAPHSH